MDKFRELTCVKVNQGDTVLFWDDNWQLDNSVVPLNQNFARLFSFAIDTFASVKDFMECQKWETLCHLPLSHQAHLELLRLHQMVQNM